MPDIFPRDELRQLRASLLAGEPLTCPLCRVPMDRREVPPRPDLSYVRDRVWVVCPSCHASAVLDRREEAP